MPLSRTRLNCKYRILSLREKHVVIYDDHRWILPLIFEAQEDKLVPRPCTLVTFDRHHDAIVPLPPALEVITDIRARETNYVDVVELVESNLSTNNNDWLRAGMELGILGDIINFGARETRNVQAEFEDHLGNNRKIHFLNLPGGTLQHQGSLADIAKSEELQPIWDVLGWERNHPDGIFCFAKGRERIILDFDLDCFAMDWTDYLFPWDEEVWKEEFHKFSDYWSTKGLSGADVVNGLIDKAGLISIARSPIHCGGPAKVEKILSDVNRFLFYGELPL